MYRASRAFSVDSLATNVQDSQGPSGRCWQQLSKMRQAAAWPFAKLVAKAFPSWQLPSLQEAYDLNESVDTVRQKLIDAAGAGKSFTSPGWLTQLGRLWGGKSVRHAVSVPP